MFLYWDLAGKEDGIGVVFEKGKVSRNFGFAKYSACGKVLQNIFFRLSQPWRSRIERAVLGQVRHRSHDLTTHQDRRSCKAMVRIPILPRLQISTCDRCRT